MDHLRPAGHSAIVEPAAPQSAPPCTDEWLSLQVIIVRNNLKGTKKRIRSKRYQMFEKAIMSPIRGCLRGAGKAMDFIADMIG